MNEGMKHKQSIYLPNMQNISAKSEGIMPYWQQFCFTGLKDLIQSNFSSANGQRFLKDMFSQFSQSELVCPVVTIVYAILEQDCEYY